MEGNPWEAPVGRFILAFGSIEHCTISLLSCLPDCQIPKNAPLLTLGARIEILREILPRYPGAEYAEALGHINAVSSLIGRRNLVAHNSLWFDIYTDGDRVMMTQHLVSSRDRKKKLTLDEMRKLAEDVHRASMNLSGSTLEVMRNHVDHHE